MKVILVNGSPREKGSTYTSLTVVEKALNDYGIDTEMFWIGADAISGCRGCGACGKLGKCVINDTVNQFCEKAKCADGFVFGSPVHYAAMSGAMSSFMDRAFYSGGRDTYYLKPAAGITVARRGGNIATFDQLNRYFGIMEMPIITSTYWNMVYAAKAEDVALDREGICTMENLAKNMAYILKCKEVAAANGVELPERRVPEKTNFTK